MTNDSSPQMLALTAAHLVFMLVATISGTQRTITPMPFLTLFTLHLRDYVLELRLLDG